MTSTPTLKLTAVVHRVLTGYRRVLARLLTLLAATAALIAAAFVVVFPLWLFATQAPAVYTTVITAVVALAALALPVWRLCKSWSWRRFLPILTNGGLVLAAGFLLYLAGTFYAAARPVPATVVLFIVLVGIGYRASAGSRKSKEQ